MGPEYWGLVAIAKRLGCQSPITVLRRMVHQGFPMFKRVRNHRVYWYTTEAMIHHWELRMADLARREWMNQSKQARRWMR